MRNVMRNGRTHQKEANSLHQDPQYEKQELKAALLLMSNGSSMHWVIKMVMKMNAAEPFNVPKDLLPLLKVESSRIDGDKTSKSKALVDSKSKSSRKHDGGGGEKKEESVGLVGEKEESKSSSKVKDSKSKSKSSSKV
ncbi:hypothetical protein LOK49_LG10G00296 [Camellia lanceoleosa]|uniref:Uncharacterized protein n=1 Tax=Camellia lanceoleosa TaxID=1840588 RepID=A0ACC0G9E7_9ERIC|nr:hypothetical protein LOK49_LG10G00296 [Camellia lanceoleosa]